MMIDDESVWDKNQKDPMRMESVLKNMDKL